MIRKTLSVLFAALILFNLFGYYFVFKCDQVRVKGEMKAMMRSSSFQAHSREIIILNPATDRDFKMIDKDEILYHGKLYDIISTRNSGSSIIINCVNDTKEEQLLASYNKYSTWVAGMNAPEKSRNNQAMLYHIIKHALLNRYSLQAPSNSTNIRFCEPQQELNSISILPDFPPPRLS
jgi:hypothetical protein